MEGDITPVKPEDIVKIMLTDKSMRDAILVAHSVVESLVDRKDLHDRDYLERFIDCLIGEVAERMVLEWLKKKDKFGESAVNKVAAMPDMGHDIWLRDTHGKRIRASVKSSLSALKSTPEEILNTFTLATKFEEVREINIQVYFWLSLYSTPRISVPSMRQAAIVAWAPAEDLAGARFNSYKGEHRPAPDKKLSELRPMKELVAKLI